MLQQWWTQVHSALPPLFPPTLIIVLHKKTLIMATVSTHSFYFGVSSRTWKVQAGPKLLRWAKSNLTQGSEPCLKRSRRLAAPNWRNDQNQEFKCNPLRTIWLIFKCSFLTNRYGIVIYPNTFEVYTVFLHLNKLIDLFDRHFFVKIVKNCFFF